MNGVLGMAELLLGTTLDEHQRHLAETVFRSGESLLRILNDILDFSKIEACKLELECVDFDLHDQIEETMEVIADNAHRKGLEFICQIENNVPNRVMGDSGRLRQILTNLIGNSIKFTERGEVMVRATLCNDIGDSVLLMFEVKDTGIGIPLEAQAKIFDAFSQSDGSMSRRYGGTGLGLSISKQLCEMMGGEMEVESKPGIGSTFRFKIRLKKQPSGESVQMPCRYEHPRNLRVLIVDDNETNRSVLQYQIDSWGIPNVSAECGQQALDQLRQAANEGNHFNVAILDMMMPGMDGLELARRIKEDPAIANTALIMLTSVGQYGEIEKSYLAGVSACLTKPARQSQLYNALMNVTGGFCKAQPVPPASPVTRKDFSPVLLAEDNPTNQRVCLAMLENLECRRIDVVSNGREALKALARTQYGLVLMDCQMPEMDGYEAARRIRKKETEIGAGTHLPIIALTAHAVNGARQECLAAGMDDYLSKPFTLNQLEAMLDRWLPKSPGSDGVLHNIPGTSALSTLLETGGDEALSDASDGAVIDGEMLLDILMLQDANKQPDLLSGIIRSYLANSDLLMEQLHKASETDAREEVRELAHSLKSSSANVGALRLADIYKRMETACENSETLEHDLISRMDREYGKVKAALARYLSTGK